MARQQRSASRRRALLAVSYLQAPDAEREPESNGTTPAPIVEYDKAIDENDEQTQADLEALEHDILGKWGFFIPLDWRNIY